jgi:ubiquinol-cytochrome c reductase cytochrome c subunit
VIALLIGVGSATISEAAADAPTVPKAAAAQLDSGAALYAIHCGSCHGDGGTGVIGRGPDLRSEGAAAVDFVLRTGRMPLADPFMQARRGPVRFNPTEIEALVAYVSSLGSGPGIPEVDAASGDLAAGGDLFRLNCAACHVASGAGAAIGGGRRAPDLMAANAVEIGEAIVSGPGAMPTFAALSDRDVDGIARYIGELQHERTTSVRSLGGAGPVAEGLAAWLLALVPLLAFTRWMGSAHAPHDETDVDDESEVAR